MSKLGFLSVCIDRRFWKTQLDEVLKETGLTPTDVWFDARAGGAGKLVEEKAFAGADHAYHSGAKIMVWGMHGDHCGGFPGKSNEELHEIHKKALEVVKARHPEAIHYSIWSESSPPVITLNKL